MTNYAPRPAPEGQQDGAGAIRPTLFIGLGGTGKEVLLRLRRKFYERFGSPGLPCVSYLWLDTDTLDRMAQGEPMDAIYREVGFTEREQIPLLQGKVKEDLAEVFRNRTQYPHIHNWLYQEVERFGTEIQDGAGGVRAVGKLTFYYHFLNTIDPRIRGILREIRTQEVIDQTRNIIGPADFVASPQVFLVTSVAGGTGCGTFLDCVFLLKKLSREAVAIDRIVGLVFLPSVYYPTANGEAAQRSYGNAYAALKELEFYTLRRRDFKTNGAGDDTGLSIDYEAEWVRGRTEKVQGPPFSVTYLLDRENEGEIGLATRSELFHMVAESLFLDFMPGAFSTGKRSHYSNVTQYLSGPQGSSVSYEGVDMAQEFARRYASFGMSKIEVPTDLLKGACASQLAHDILRYWDRENVEPDIRARVLQDMSSPERRLDDEGLVSRFDPGWREAMKSEVDAIFRGRSVKEPAHVDDITAKLNEFQIRVLRADGTDPARWGTVIASIRGQRQKVQEGLKADLRQWIKDVMNDPARGPRAAIVGNSHMHQLIENLKTYYQARDGVPQPKFEARKAEAAEDVGVYKDEAEAVKKEIKEALANTGVAALRLKDWTVETLIERLKDAQQQYALAAAEVCLMEEAKLIAKSGVEFLEKLRPGLVKFTESLDVMAKRFLGKKEGFLSYGQGVLFLRYFHAEHDWPAFYALGVDGERQPLPVNPGEEQRRYLDETFGAQSSLWELVEHFAREGEAGVEGKLGKHCEARFIRDFEANPRQVNVLDHPQLKDREDMQAAIDKLVRCARPMVKRNAQSGSTQIQAEKWAYLGIAERNGEPYASFIQKVKGKLHALGYDDGHIEVLSTNKPWEVYLYLVSYAFPLSSLPEVTNEYHNAYYDFYQELRRSNRPDSSRIPLHLSKTWEGRFDDLHVYGDREAREIKEALEAVLVGSMLKVLELRVNDSGEIEYGYRRDVFGGARREPLGTRRETIDLLRNNSTLRQLLLTTISLRESALKKPELRNYYWLLLYLRFSETFPPKSPDEAIILNKLKEAGMRLTKSGVKADSLSLETFDESARAAEARKRLGDAVQWVGNFPVLKELNYWLEGQRP
jgi:Tubulin like